MEGKLLEINAELESYKKFLPLVKEQWTEQNKILGPTLKIKEEMLRKCALRTTRVGKKLLILFYLKSSIFTPEQTGIYIRNIIDHINFNNQLNENKTIIKNLSLLFAMLIINMFAQTNVGGSVVDVQNNPLPGVNIVIQGSNFGTTADFDGNFTLNISQELRH